MNDSISTNYDARTLLNLSAPPPKPHEGMAALGGTPGATGRAAAKEAVQAFQNILVEEMVKAMRLSIPKSGLLEKSSGEEIFESFLDSEFSRAMGRQMGATGMTKALQRHLGLFPLDPVAPEELALPEPPPLPSESRGKPLPPNDLALPALENVLQRAQEPQMKGGSHP